MTVAGDDDLVVRTAQGDERAFQILVERWERPVFAFMDRMVGSPEDALDLSQETFLRLYTQAGRYQPQGKFRSWLFRIAGNLARSHLRRKRIVRWLSFDLGHHDLAATDEPIDRQRSRSETRRLVRAALSRLPDRQRQAVVLRRYEGLSHKEIAAALDTTIPAVESLIQRALAALRRDLGGKDRMP